VRGFSVLLLGLYFAERAIAERQVPGEKIADLFLKFEQLAAYSRIAVQAAKANDYTEDEIRGIQRVKKNLVGKRVRISTAPRWQILANQKTYGLWGLYMVAARNSKLVQAETVRLSEEARAFVKAEYDNQKHLTIQNSEQIISFLCSEQWFEPSGKDIKLAKKLALLLGELTPTEKIFYKNHLVECIDSDIQSTLWQGMLAVTSPRLPFSMWDLSELIKYAEGWGQHELTRRLIHIQVAESVFAPAAYLFNFMSSRDGQSIEKVADEVRQAWSTKLRNIDPVAFAQLLEMFPGEIDYATRTRLSQIASSLAEGGYQPALELLIEQNRAVMQARGGLAWIKLKEGLVSVDFKENAGDLPAREDLPLLWTNSYFLNALKTVGFQIEGTIL
jgi:hypothetical protein